ncbi:uncharacterized protein LOC125653733 isoform X1 [Ostrea edulis]|uniref:uncharacterized protein LOC125653733 isoform X1 n=1 Tax=Ostrea edulis TaxID=37623 RepID=UPI0024AF3440|nr:uncharacterized protein LOC125653733 isoform X1 [Ostrea edulis]
MASSKCTACSQWTGSLTHPSRKTVFLIVFSGMVVCSLLVHLHLDSSRKFGIYHDHCAKWTNISDIVIPNDKQLHQMSLYTISCLYQRYVTSLQSLCTEPKRFGNVDYGGARICMDKGVVPSTGCVVYSYNHDLSERFVKQMEAKFKSAVVFFGRDIFSSHYSDMGGFNKILTSQGRDISVVVLKINSRDFPLFRNFTESLDRVLVKQIILEIHYDRDSESKSDYVTVLAALRRLYTGNYLTYWFDRNWNCVKNEKKMSRRTGCFTVNLFRKNTNDSTPSREIDLPKISPLGTSPIDKQEMMKYQDIYLRYISKHQILCKEMLRLGNIVDGGWDICHDVRFRPGSTCIVYSFGIDYDFSFDEDMEKTYGCDVFSFDPSMNMDDHKHSDHIRFYRVGLGDKNKDIWVGGKKWKIETLKTIQEKLGHTNKRIDMLKIDIEGNEIAALPEMVESGALKNVAQLCLELHHYYDLGTLRKLHDIGFRIFWAHQNPFAEFYANGESYSYGDDGVQSIVNESSKLSPDCFIPKSVQKGCFPVRSAGYFCVALFYSQQYLHCYSP